ncbi:MAG: ornithine cyclodeaminase family protein [Rhodospirillales bacterium]|nr:ornithine cyclodeaminase family protein [Rhodospirillales bacterium]
MIQFDADMLKKLLDRPALIDALDDAFRTDVTAPLRHHHTIKETHERDSFLLLMPAWDDVNYIGIKIATILPQNSKKNLPAVQATIMLLDRTTGQPLAVMDGAEITARRTAGASALASRYLSRPESSHLLMVGTGVLAPHLIQSHSAVRPISKVSIWGRNFEKAQSVAATFSDTNINVQAVPVLEDAVAGADIISCATLTQNPLIKGAWLKPGQHLDLVGAFTPDMRESDDDAIRRARVFVDAPGAITEAGEICQPIAAGVLAKNDIQGDLFSMARGTASLRQSADEITLFKSAGTAIEDLAAARLAYERYCN